MYTKGEWKVDDRSEKGYFGVDDLDKTIFPYIINMPSISILGRAGAVVTMGDIDKEEAMANAHLIAAAPDMREEIVEAKGWLADFVMRFYISAETPTYEKMKKLYQELDTFQRELGVKALAKAGGKC